MPGVLSRSASRSRLPVIVVAAFLAGVGIEMFGVLWDTTMQQQIPGEMLSRLYSYDMVGSIALMPIGYAVAGPVGGGDRRPDDTLGAAGVAVCRHTAVLLVRDVQRLEREPCHEPLTSSL